MAKYSVIAGATNFTRKQYKADGESIGTFVITVSNEIKEKIVDGEDFTSAVEINDLLFLNAVKQKSNLNGWKLSVEVQNGTTILIGKVIGVVHTEEDGAPITYATCLMSNGQHFELGVAISGAEIVAQLSGNGLGGSDLPVPTIADEGKVLAVGDGGLWTLSSVDTTEFLAPAYDSTKTYNTSDLVVYGGALYVCKADNTTGTWDNTKWETTTIAESVLGLLNEAI